MKIKVKITTEENMKFFKCEKNTIKTVDLEEYINCVVASEIGNAPLEACKAQAVASRTFIVSRGALDGKIIGDTSATHQSYRASRNNYKNCKEAVEATIGQVLIYGGQYASTNFCASNGGRTYSSKEVWGGERPYLLARTDDWTRASEKKKNGHGVGLSQAGAIYAASNGIQYRDILDFYYPGTMISHIREEEDEDYVRKVLEEIRARVMLAQETLKEGL